MTMSARIVNDSSAHVRRPQAAGAQLAARSRVSSANRSDFTVAVDGFHPAMSAAAGPCDALSPACNKSPAEAGGCLGRIDGSPVPQPLDLPARSTNVVTALNSSKNLSLTQGGCLRVGGAPASEPAGQGIVKCDVAAHVPRSPPRRLTRWVNAPSASSMSTQPFEASEIAPRLSPRAGLKVAGSKRAGVGFSSWLENVSEQLRCSDCAPRRASDSVLHARHASAGGRATHVHRALQFDRRDGG